MKKRDKAIFVFVSLILVIGLVGVSVMGYFSGGTTPLPTSSNTPTANGTDYASLKSQAASLEQQLKADPANSSLQVNLGNVYYDLGVAAQESAPDETNADFAKAIENYQLYLKNNKDINVLVDMATAAFYGGNNDLAEKSYKEALAEQPDFFNALLNYGVFLSHVKNDYKGAIALWQKALDKDPKGPNAANLQNLISQYQSMAASTGSTGSTSANSGSTTTASDDGSNNPHWAGVEAVIYQKCITCHGPGGSAADKSLQTYSDVLKYVTPKDDKSPLLVKMKDGHAKGVTIKSDDQDIIEAWIQSLQAK